MAAIPDKDKDKDKDQAPPAAPAPESPALDAMAEAEIAALRAEVEHLRAQAVARDLTADDEEPADTGKPKLKTIKLPDGGKAVQNLTTGTWTATPGESA